MPSVEYKMNLGNLVGKPVHFLEAERFSEFFSNWRYFAHGDAKTKRFPEVEGVTDYCMALNTPLEESLSVKVKPHLVKWIHQHMIRSDYDSWYFQLVTRSDGTLLIVKNNQILASRWLALLDTDQLMSDIRSGFGISMSA